MANAYDTIIVGAGAAGCVLAARLAASRHVLLVEAGPDPGPDPAGWPDALLRYDGPQLEAFSWGFRHRQDGFALPRGRVVGGSTAVNTAIWLRGSRLDYDRWEALGNPGWNFDTLLPYFRRAEADPLGPDDLHGRDGPVPVWRVPDANLSRVDHAFMRTAAELGFQGVDDLNGNEYQVPAFGKTPKNLRDGLRWNAALAFLAPARRLPTLSVLADTLVDRVLLDRRRATGVRTAAGEELPAREVILCAGAYLSPALLLRSGIGPAADLAALGIPPVHDLPGVGAHLLDHPYIAPFTSTLTTFAIAPHAAPHRTVYIQTMLKARSRRETRDIDLHIYPRELYHEPSGRWLLGFGVSLQYATSRGAVRLTSPDPLAPPDIDHNYFSDPADLDALCDGLELTFELARTPPLATLLDQTNTPSLDRATLRELVRRDAGTTFHPSSTCRMGPAGDPLAVVDGTGRVHGMAGLRVVDASIFPDQPRCNLHAPTIAVAARIADVITGRASRNENREVAR